MGARYKLGTIDGFAMSTPSGPWRVRRRKSQALITYLWLHTNKTERRSQLANLLWSRGSEAEARTSLRQELSRLRREMSREGEAPFLEADKFSIWLTVNQIGSDIQTVEETLEAGCVPELLNCTASPIENFLQHLEGIDPEFDIWISVQRIKFQQRCVHALRSIIQDENGDPEAPRALLNLDPSDEGACRQLMEIAINDGRPLDAIKLYDQLVKLLRSEYDAEPSSDLTDFIQPIRVSQKLPTRQTLPVKRQSDMGRPPLLLVRPVDLTRIDDAATLRFNVLRGELIGALSRFQDWSVRDFRGGVDVETQEGLAGKTYDISLMGEAAEEGDYLSINLRVSETGSFVWSETFLVDYARMHGHQRSIIQKLALALNIETSAHRLSQIVGNRNVDLDVYDKWLLAQSLLMNWRPEDETKAEALFRSILSQSGTFAPALSGLVQVLNTRHHIFPGVTRDPAREKEALELARRAARMAPHDCRTQLTLAWCFLMNAEYEQAAYYFHLALEINENDPWTLISCAQGLCYAGEKPSAIELVERARIKGRGGEPMYWAYAACIYFHNGYYEKALDANKKALGAAYFVEGMQAAILGQLGETRQAGAALETFAAHMRSSWYSRQEPSLENIIAWFLQLFPIRSAADIERLEAGLEAAGFVYSRA